MLKAGTKTGTRNHTALLVSNPPLLFPVLLLTRGDLTETIMCVGNVDRDVIAFFGTLLRHFTQLESGLQDQNDQMISIWNLYSNACQFVDVTVI